MQPDEDKRPALIRDWWKELQSDPGARGRLRRCRAPIEALALSVLLPPRWFWHMSVRTVLSLLHGPLEGNLGATNLSCRVLAGSAFAGQRGTRTSRRSSRALSR
jgi:hypothetical protein